MTPKKSRQKLGISQAQMARLMGGTSRFTVAKWEQGHRQPSAQARELMELLAWLHDNEPEVYHRWLAKI